MLKRLICFTLVFVYLFSFLTYANPFIDEANKYEDDKEDYIKDLSDIDLTEYLSNSETSDYVVDGDNELDTVEVDSSEFYRSLSHAEYLGTYQTKVFSRTSNALNFKPDKYFPLFYETNLNSGLHSNRLWTDSSIIPAEYGGFNKYLPSVDLKGAQLYVFISSPDGGNENSYFIIKADKNGIFDIYSAIKGFIAEGKITKKDLFHGGYITLNKNYFPRGNYSMMFQANFISGFPIAPVLECLMFNSKKNVTPSVDEADYNNAFGVENSNYKESLSLVTYPFNGRSVFNYSTDGTVYSRMFLNMSINTSNTQELVFRFIGHAQANHDRFPSIVQCGLRFDSYRGEATFKLDNINAEDAQAEAFENMNNNLGNIAEGQNLVLEKMQELIQHISDQLFAFWNQLAGEFTNLYAKLEKKHSDDTNALVESISNMTNKIVNQSKENTKKEIDNENRNHDEALHGFDNNTMNDDKIRLDASLDNYNQAEDELIGEITNNLNDFTFNKNIFTSFVEPIKGCSLFLSALFDASDILQNYILFVLAITVATIFIGLYRFRG